jgi:hypothetical protein
MGGGLGFLGSLYPGLFGADPNTPAVPAGMIDPAGIRQQGLFSALTALGTGLIAAGERRNAMQPSLLPQALASFGPGYQQGVQTATQNATIAQQAQQQQAYDRMVAMLPQGQQDVYRAMGYQQGAPIIGQALLRQGHFADSAEHARLGLPDGTVWIDATGERHILQTPGVQGLTAYFEGLARPTIGQPGGVTYPPYYFAPGGAPGAPGAGGAAPAAPAGGGAPAAPAAGGGAAPSTAAQPQGTLPIRTNNWLAWSPGGQVASFATPEAGVARASQQIDQLFPNGNPTPQQLARTWSQGPNYDPMRASADIRQRVDNYTTRIAQAGGVAADQPLNMRDPDTRQRVMSAMAGVETGGVPQGGDQVIARGIQMAQQPGATFAPVPRGQQAQAPQTAQAGGGSPVPVADPTAPVGTRQANTSQVIQRGPGGEAWAPAQTTPDAAMEAYRRGLGERLVAIHGAADTARNQLQTINALETARQAWRAQGGQEGAMGPLQSSIVGSMQAFGLDPRALGLPADASPAQMIEAMTRSMAIGNVAHGAGQPGVPASNFSEADRNFTVGMSANLRNTPAANDFLIEVARANANRAVEMENRWNAAAARGVSPNQFLAEWNQYTHDHPIFDAEARGFWRDDPSTAVQRMREAEAARATPAPATAAPLPVAPPLTRGAAAAATPAPLPAPGTAPAAAAAAPFAPVAPVAPAPAPAPAPAMQPPPQRGSSPQVALPPGPQEIARMTPQQIGMLSDERLRALGASWDLLSADQKAAVTEAARARVAARRANAARPQQ